MSLILRRSVRHYDMMGMMEAITIFAVNLRLDKHYYQLCYLGLAEKCIFMIVLSNYICRYFGKHLS